jgi:hypothetical protein
VVAAYQIESLLTKNGYFLGMRVIALSLAMIGFLAAFGAAAESFSLPSDGFRLTGGVSVVGNKVTVNAVANGTGTLTADRTVWSAGGSLVPDSRASLKDVAPYGGLGYTRNFIRGVTVSWDTGALFGAMPILPRFSLPGLSEDLAFQNDYAESHVSTMAIQPLTEVTLSVKF